MVIFVRADLSDFSGTLEAGPQAKDTRVAIPCGLRESKGLMSGQFGLDCGRTEIFTIDRYLELVLMLCRQFSESRLVLGITQTDQGYLRLSFVWEITVTMA